MSFIISAYSAESFKEYNLPSLNNSDYELLIKSSQFNLQNDITLKMEVVNNQWTIFSRPEYRLFVNDARYDTVDISDGVIVSIVTEANEKLNLITTETDSPFHAFEKYRINGDAEIGLGRDASNDIVFNMVGVGRKHATITKSGRTAKISNHSDNGIYINSSRIDGTVDLKFGDYINIIGFHIVYLGSLIAVDSRRAAEIKTDKLTKVSDPMRRDEEPSYKSDESSAKRNSYGKSIFRRAPRYVEVSSEQEIEVEGPPKLSREEGRSVYSGIGPAVTMALPLTLGLAIMIAAYAVNGSGASNALSVLLMVAGLLITAASAVVGVVWALSAGKRQRKESEFHNRQRLARYEDYLSKKTDEIRSEYELAQNRLRDNYPEASKCIAYTDSSAELWCRNLSHEDVLTYRLGTGNIPFPSNIKIPAGKFSAIDDPMSEKPAQIKEEFSTLYDVPVTVDLLKHRLVGIIGADRRRGAVSIAKSLSAQIAANNCYTDVKLGYIYNSSSCFEEGEWDFAKWLPHVWSEDKKTRFIASDEDEAADVFYELGNVFRSRSEDESFKRERTVPKPYYILFISDPSLIYGEMISKYILSDDENLGLSVILLSEQYEELPNRCEYIIENSELFTGAYETSTASDTRVAIKFDDVDSDGLDAFARRLGGLRVMEAEYGGDIPASLTFFEMMGISKPEDIPVKELWTKNRINENIKGMLGHKSGGEPLYLDVHEKQHGPHGLVAGTTGSGKSETLQTYILSLASNYSPDDVEFFIIDYKGGGMANLFAGLPHLAGRITNLSGNQVKRAMISIKSENKRRQRIFSETGINHINAYTKMYKSGEVSEAIPHLFIIIDEFAELKREEPDFMRDLISVAQVGRSLGVHLILSTQKPSGTVDDNIRSNSRFRLCLRVQDKEDSNDMLRKPDAAFITQAGRGYLQVGNDEVYEMFQSGYSGAVYDEDAYVNKPDAAGMLTLSGKVEMNANSIRQRKKKATSPSSHNNERTQLDAVKEYLAKVSSEMGYERSHNLWLPVLEEKIYLNEFDEFRASSFKENGKWKESGSGDNLSLKAFVGKMDDPENQLQMPFEIDFADEGNLAICGTVVCGKSTALQTIAYSLIQRYTPDEVNIYALDFSSNMLSPFEAAPHVGGIMSDNDEEKIDKFFNMMNSILEERKSLLHGGNYKQFVQTNGVSIPAVFIMIDNYASFKQKTNEAYEEDILRLSREGASNGIYLIVTGGGFSTTEITSRIGENFRNVVTLALKDKYEYGELLHSMQINVMPERAVKGRGLAYYGDRILEFQTALSVEADNDYERLEHIAEECRAMASAWKGKKARPVPVIPEDALWRDFVKLDDYKEMTKNKSLLPVGYDYADASVYGIELENVFCYGIYGGIRTGKTNMLKACILSAADKGADIYVMDSEDRPLGEFDGAGFATYCKNDDEAYEAFKGLIPELKKRREGKDGFRPIFIFISELDQFLSMIYKSKHDMQSFLENLLDKGRGKGLYVFADLSLRNKSTAAAYSAFESFTGYRTGIHLGGKTNLNNLLNFDYIPYSEQTKTEKAGTGILPEASKGETSKVVIPLITEF